MMIYKMDFGKGKLTPIETEGKNALPKGTILQLNGYDDPRYVIVENMGIDQKYGYGAKYLTVNIDKPATGYHDAYSLEFLANKTSNMIQMYITNETIPEEQVNELYRLALENEAKAKVAADIAQEKRNAALEKGKVWVEANRPAWAKAVIVAYKEFDDCDMMTDYFSTKSGEPYLLAWSKHTRDIFSEMRKAAANMEETKHLGPGKGHFEPKVVLCEDVQSGGAAYWKGSYSHWHRELEQDEHSNQVVFTTKAEADAHTEARKLEPVGFEGTIVNFEWSINEQSIEHREKHSMGAGYYLKAANRYSTGWKVEKWGLDKWRIESIYLAAGEGRIRIAQPDDKTPNPVTVKGITITENGDKDGVEIRFPEKPEENTLDTLKAHGFRWSRFTQCWYKKRTPETLAFAQSLTA